MCCRPNTRDLKKTESRLRKHVVAPLGNTRLDFTIRRDLSALHSPLAKARQTSTANRVHAVIKGLYGWAVREGHLKNDPAAGW